MGSRAFVTGFLLALGGCEYCYCVERGRQGLAAVDPLRLQAAVESHPAVAGVVPWDGECCAAWFRRADAHAMLVYEVSAQGAETLVGSDWWGSPPEYAGLCASITLQDDLLRDLATAVPGFPLLVGRPLDWTGLQNPRGARFAELKARYEAEHGK
jgi:hypothetical protein